MLGLRHKACPAELAPAPAVDTLSFRNALPLAPRGSARQLHRLAGSTPAVGRTTGSHVNGESAASIHGAALGLATSSERRWASAQLGDEMFAGRPSWSSEDAPSAVLEEIGLPAPPNEGGEARVEGCTASRMEDTGRCLLPLHGGAAGPPGEPRRLARAAPALRIEAREGPAPHAALGNAPLQE
jgi:hypothetical protein